MDHRHQDDHYVLIPQLLYMLDAKKYLELGVQFGGSLVPAAKKLREMHGSDYVAVGVDIAATPQLMDNINDDPLLFQFHEESTASFFATHAQQYGEFDVIFIDACHKYEAVKHDFWGAFACLKDQGVIVMHDNWPGEPGLLDQYHCDDSWRFADEISRSVEYRDQLEFMTLPYSPGLSLCRKRNQHLKFNP